MQQVALCKHLTNIVMSCRCFFFIFVHKVQLNLFPIHAFRFFSFFSLVLYPYGKVENYVLYFKIFALHKYRNCKTIDFFMTMRRTLSSFTLSPCVDDDVEMQQLMMMLMLTIMLSLMHGVYLHHRAAAAEDRIPCVISVDQQQQQQQPDSATSD